MNLNPIQIILLIQYGVLFNHMVQNPDLGSGLAFIGASTVLTITYMVSIYLCKGNNNG